MISNNPLFSDYSACCYQVCVEILQVFTLQSGCLEDRTWILIAALVET